MFLASLPPSPISFLIAGEISFSIDLFSVTGARVLLWGGLVAGVRVGKATGGVYPPGLGFMWFFSPGGVGHWAPNLHLRLTLLIIKKQIHDQ